MFTEARTTAAEVIETVLSELSAQINALNASVAAKRQHPTFITNPGLRQQANELRGAYALAAKVVGGCENLPLEIHGRYQAAIAGARDVVGKLA